MPSPCPPADPRAAARLALPKRGTIEVVGSPAGVTLTADTEPDADGDGYGDRTQDACPGDAADHAAPCSATRTFGSPLHLVPDASGSPAAGNPTAGVQTTPATFTAPIDGVLTRWRVRARPAGHALALQVLRDGAVVASTPAVTPATNGVITSDVQLPVRAGDRLGLTSTGSLDAVATMPDETLALYLPSDLGPYHVRLLVQADVEPDADRDGKGDVSQDRADLQVTGSGPAAVGNLDNLAQSFTVRNAGPDAALDVRLALTTPVAPPDGVTCTGGGDPATCAIGTLAPGAALTFAPTYVVPAIFPPPGGTFASTATATSTTRDPDPTNNAASVTTERAGPGPIDPRIQPPCANLRRGTRDDDALTGTASGDRLVGNDGSDLLRGLAGDDCLEGGAGADVLDGGDGDDRLAGASGRDRLYGGTGNDSIKGNQGNDRLIGGPGDDALSPGDGRDSVSAGGGNDTINARDGVRETIDCGAGTDTVRADRRDRLRHCESVTRR